MTSFRRMVSFIVCCVLSAGISAQIIEPAQRNRSGIDTFDGRREQLLIPGETMGQKMESLLFWTVPEKERRFPHMHQIFPAIEVAAGNDGYPLYNGSRIRSVMHGGYSLASYMNYNQIAGVIVLQNDSVRLEAYGDGVDSNTVWTSFSVGKSVTSMLLGVALGEGDVSSLDDSLAKYIPELAGRDYGKVTVRQLLTMTSGIQWNEDYADHQSDVAQMYLQPCRDSEAHILTYMKSLKAADTPGRTWNYSTGETDLLGILIQKATGKSLAAYLSEKIWKPWGMMHAAFWLADECSGLNLGGSGLSATLRDYARLGTVMLHGGQRGSMQLFSQHWLRSATALLFPTGKDGGGYGYLWWRFPNGSYAAFGIFGQMIYINPATGTVIAQVAAWPKASSRELAAKRADFIQAVEQALAWD